MQREETKTNFYMFFLFFFYMLVSKTIEFYY
jgi:hypothetical protein